MARGGYRPGAGRPRKAAVPGVVKATTQADGPAVVAGKARGKTPLAYMLSVMADTAVDDARRDRMAVAAAPYMHGRAADERVGKKEQRQEAANRAAEKFAVPAGPKLIVNNR